MNAQDRYRDRMMALQDLYRDKMMALLVQHSHPMAETIGINEALRRCRASDVRQIAWECKEAGIKVTAATLLAMALSRSVTRQVAEQYACQEQLKQAEKLVPKTGDKRST